jgi:hypothetical protein
MYPATSPRAVKLLVHFMLISFPSSSSSATERKKWRSCVVFQSTFDSYARYVQVRYRRDWIRLPRHCCISFCLWSLVSPRCRRTGEWMIEHFRILHQGGKNFCRNNRRPTPHLLVYILKQEHSNQLWCVIEMNTFKNILIAEILSSQSILELSCFQYRLLSSCCCCS